MTFHGQAGTLHRPIRSPGRGVAVLICGPAGREGRCAYRPLHLWAQRLAQQGFSVLRYDHPGEGDSASLPADADQWRAWRNGLARAAAFARAHTGASELVICGLRIGAALALAAADRVRPEGLMLLAPVLTGEAWLRDLRLACVVQGAPPTRDGSIQVDGLRLSPTTVERLREIDLTGAPVSWRAAFLAGPRASREVADALGPDLTTRGFDGLAAFFKEAHVNMPPWPVFEAATDWLETFAAGVPAARPAPPVPAAQLRGADWRETPVEFGCGLRGVLTLPTRKGGRQAVIIGNTAADPRAGIGSFAARAARTLAGRGVAVLRLDFAGMGESEAPGATWRTHVYETSRLADFRAAAEVLRRRGYADITLLGVCTGGFHAVEAVLDGAFDRAIAINSWLVWRPETMPLEMRSEVSQAAAPQPAGERPAGLARVCAGVGRRLKALASAQAPDALCLGVRGRIRRAGARGARIHLIFGRGDTAMHWFEAEFGLNGAWLARQPGVTLAIRPGLDHALFSEESQQAALAEICDLLGVAQGNPVPVPAAPVPERREPHAAVGGATAGGAPWLAYPPSAPGAAG